MRTFMTTIISGALLAITLAGCATNTASLNKFKRRSIEQGAVFEELKDGTPVQA